MNILPSYSLSLDGNGKQRVTWIVDQISVAPNGTEVWRTDSTGAISGSMRFPDGSVAAPSLAFANETGSGLFRVGAGQFATTSQGTANMIFGSATSVTALGPFVIGNGVAFGTASNLISDAANTLAQRNGTNAQTLRVYGTTTGSKYTSVSHDGTNGSVTTSSGALTVGQVTTVGSLPTGVAGARAFVTDATATTFASIVAGGGSNGVPVYHDGTNWRIG